MPGERILIVDDNQDIVDQLDVFLTREGFQAMRAYGGAAGIRLALEDPPDVILLDITMPDVDGYQVLGKLKEAEVPTRVIVITADLDIQTVVKFIKAGAHDYLPKPFTPDDVRLRIEKVLVMETRIVHSLSQLPLSVTSALNKSERLERDLARQSAAYVEQIATLKAENKRLTREHQWTQMLIKLIQLAASTAVACVFWILGLVNSPISLMAVVVVLFILFFLPLDKISRFSAKGFGAEAGVEVSDK